jgi:hypothetical protein
MSLNLSTLLGTMVALSVAVERVVEILKQFCGTWPVAKLLFTARATPGAENARCACMYVLSGTIGTLAARAGHVLILPNVHHDYVNYVVAGLLSSGGSSFWNHALDMMQAAKVTKEQTAAALVQANANITAAVVVPVPVMAPVPAGD